MKEKEENLIDIDALMDSKFGKEGTPERAAFREKAVSYFNKQEADHTHKEELSHNSKTHR